MVRRIAQCVASMVKGRGQGSADRLSTLRSVGGTSGTGHAAGRRHRPELDLRRTDPDAAPVRRARGVGPCSAASPSPPRPSAPLATTRGSDCSRGPGAEPALQRREREIGVRLRPVLAPRSGPRTRIWRRSDFQCMHEGRLAAVRDFAAPSRCGSWCRRRSAVARCSFSRTIARSADLSRPPWQARSR